MLELTKTHEVAQRVEQACVIWEAAFATVMMGDDRAIAQVWVAGVAQPAAKSRAI